MAAARSAAANRDSGVAGALDQQAFSRLVNEQWLRIMGRPDAFTEEGKQFDSIVRHLMGGNLPFHAQGLMYQSRYLTNLTWRHDPERTTNLGQRHLDTRHVVYAIDPGLSADEINTNVRRIAAPPGARSRQTEPVLAERTGQIRAAADAPPDRRCLGALQPRAALPPPSHPGRQRPVALQRAIRRPGHCGFNLEERAEAFDDLVRWMEQGTRPDGDDVLAADLSGVGLRWTKPLQADDPARR